MQETFAHTDYLLYLCTTIFPYMIHLREIHTADTDYAFVEALWLQAFPEIERRDTAAQRQNTDTNPLFHCLLATSHEGEPVGFLTYWDFGSYCYGEHFATDMRLRNRGYGGQIIRAAIGYIARPLVLEVELPQDDLSRRRIGFYQRNGLTLWQDIPYVQPAYRVGGEALPMHLMATPDLEPSRVAKEVISTIRRNVYGV